MIFKDIDKAAEAIHPIFEQMGWVWGSTGIPSISDIHRKLSSLYEDVLKDDYVSMSSGRLYAERIRDTGEIVVGLVNDSIEEWMDYTETAEYEAGA